ncbi:MAG: hypothetical protein ACP59X_08020 [Solidesulfovibrio sp. DCME]|uniref:hypothetical protein n=1 Tax=Solidesulfovibrio sp. DCME TaxID=3447380 RepID=UPI003D10CCB8
MKKILAIVGGVFLVLLVAGALFFGYGVYQGKKLDASSRAYIEQNIPAILQTWSKDALLERAAPQLRRDLDKDPPNTDLLFKKFTELGKFQQMDDIKGNSITSITPDKGLIKTAHYVIQAKFDHGDAAITVNLVQAAEKWQVVGFFVNSPKMLQ